MESGFLEPLPGTSSLAPFPGEEPCIPLDRSASLKNFPGTERLYTSQHHPIDYEGIIGKDPCPYPMTSFLIEQAPFLSQDISSDMPKSVSISPNAVDENLCDIQFSKMVLNQKRRLQQLEQLEGIPSVLQKINSVRYELAINEGREIFRYCAALMGCTYQRRSLNARFEAHADSKFIDDLRSGDARRVRAATKLILKPISRRKTPLKSQEYGGATSNPLSASKPRVENDDRSDILHQSFMPTLSGLNARASVKNEKVIDRTCYLLGESQGNHAIRDKWSERLNFNQSQHVISALFSNDYDSQEQALTILSRATSK